MKRSLFLVILGGLSSSMHSAEQQEIFDTIAVLTEGKNSLNEKEQENLDRLNELVYKATKAQKEVQKFTDTLFDQLEEEAAFAKSMEQTDAKWAAFNQSSAYAPLFKAIEHNDLGEVKKELVKLQSTEPDILTTARNPIDLSPLAHAVTIGADLELIQYLVSQGAATDFTHEHVTENRDGKMQKFSGDNLLELLFTQAPVALEYKNPDITNDELEEYLFEVAKFLMRHGAPYYEAAKTVPVPRFLSEEEILEREETPYLELIFTSPDFVVSDSHIRAVAEQIYYYNPHSDIPEKTAFTALNTMQNAADKNSFQKLHRLFEVSKHLDNAFKTTPLLEAVKAGDLARATELLRDGADPDQTDILKETALIQAALDENKEMIKLLCEYGANVNKPNRHTVTPLSVLLYDGGRRLDLIELLVSYGANLNNINGAGKTALFSIAEHTSPEFLDFLFSHGIQVNKKMFSTGSTALHRAVERLSPEKVLFLINHGASIDEPDDAGRTPLLTLLAHARHDSIDEMLEHLTDAGADVHATDKDGNSALHLAAGNTSCNGEIIKTLINEYHIPVDIMNSNNETPLHYSMQRRNGPAATELVKNGASITVKNKDGKTPLDIARELNAARNLIQLLGGQPE